MPYIPFSPLAEFRATTTRVDVVDYSNASKPPKFSRMRLLVFVLGGVFFIVAGASIMYYSAVLRPAQLHDEAVATKRHIATMNAHATMIAETHATATAVAQLEAQTRARAMARAAATAQANATATALRNIYRSATTGPPNLSDALIGQSETKWHVYNTVGGGGCNFAEGALHVRMSQPGYYIPCYATNTHFTNFALEVQMQWLKGDEGGIIFRGSDAANHYYSFTLKKNGNYTLDLTKDSQHGIELISKHSSLINTTAGSINTLTIIARGGTFYLYINKRFVDSTSDNTLHAGAIALIAADDRHATEVAFRNLHVWTL